MFRLTNKYSALEAQRPPQFVVCLLDYKFIEDERTLI